jgi:hypothetical protein
MCVEDNIFIWFRTARKMLTSPFYPSFGRSAVVGNLDAWPSLPNAVGAESYQIYRGP